VHRYGITEQQMAQRWGATGTAAGGAETIYAVFLPYK
jgi:hypothetical protein